MSKTKEFMGLIPGDVSEAISEKVNCLRPGSQGTAGSTAGHPGWHMTIRCPEKGLFKVQVRLWRDGTCTNDLYATLAWTEELEGWIVLHYCDL
jgi:hypothetical protein